MAHRCKSLVIHCIDFRLGKPVKAYLEKEGFLGDCDEIALAGAVKYLSSPENQTDKDFLSGQIAISKNLHGVERIILLNHTDCGAYGGSGKFWSPKEEKDFHVLEMKRAKELILQKYPDVEVKMVLGKILPDGKVEIEEINE